MTAIISKSTIWQDSKAPPPQLLTLKAAIAGLNQPSLKTAFGISQDVDIITLDALDETQKDPESEGAMVYKQAITVQNTVTMVSNLLTNDSSTYASFAVLVDQAIGRAVSLSSVLHSPC